MGFAANVIVSSDIDKYKMFRWVLCGFGGKLIWYMLISSYETKYFLYQRYSWNLFQHRIFFCYFVLVGEATVGFAYCTDVSDSVVCCSSRFYEVKLTIPIPLWSREQMLALPLSKIYFPNADSLKNFFLPSVVEI